MMRYSADRADVNKPIVCGSPFAQFKAGRLTSIRILVELSIWWSSARTSDSSAEDRVLV